jgi:hypothetical protein
MTYAEKVCSASQLNALIVAQTTPTVRRLLARLHATDDRLPPLPYRFVRRSQPIRPQPSQWLCPRRGHATLGLRCEG